LLVRGRLYSQAALEYKQLDQDAPSPAFDVALAHNYQRLNRDSEAKKILLGMDFANATAEDQAERLYMLAEIARDDNDDGSQEGYVQQLLTSAPKSGWTQEALFSAGNKFMLRRDYESALRYYMPAWQQFPRSTNASLLHWRSAWLTYRLNRMDEARLLMEEQVEKYGDASEAANALYWLGRIAEQQSQPEVARAYYQKISERFQNYYYALLAQDRLAQLGDGAAKEVALLRSISKAVPPDVSEGPGGEDNIRFQKAKLLANAALYDLATRELQTAAADRANADWANAEMIRLYNEAGMPFKALRLAKRAVPSYAAADVTNLPKTFAEGLFPRPYWDDLQRSATANGLDPYLVASLIRQESEFNAAAISYANAYGLMQLLPAVGKETAKQIKFKHYSTADLLDPASNLKLGSAYFKAMVNEYNGQVEYALAAYNAGINRVAEWRATGTYRDIPEFVESIPFTQTREYVQAIMRNRVMYKKIYEGPVGTKVASKSTD
jgi:soluble lytic murein transglycosylase